MSGSGFIENVPSSVSDRSDLDITGYELDDLDSKVDGMSLERATRVGAVYRRQLTVHRLSTSYTRSI